MPKGVLLPFLGRGRDVLVLAQQLAAAASYYQPALLPQRKAEEGGQWRR
jgi:hypothetical protein